MQKSSKVTPYPEESVPLNDESHSAAVEDNSHQIAAMCGTVVMFGSPAYYCVEAEMEVWVDVLRIGQMESKLSVQWQCVDRSAKAGQDYQDDKGVLTFSSGERAKHVRVAICNDLHWEPEETFDITLSELTGPATLGVSRTTVHVIDNDIYPRDCPPDATAARLMFFLIKERLHKRGSKVSLSAWCYVYKAFYDTTISTVLLVFIIAEVKLESKKGNLFDEYMLAMWGAVLVWIAAYWFLQRCDFTQLDKRGRSGTRQDIRNWVAQTYMSLSDEALGSYSAEAGHILNTLDNHVNDAVNKGWYSLFLLVEGVFGLLFIIALALWLIWPRAYYVGSLVVVVLPVVTYTVMTREQVNLKLLLSREKAETGWVAAAYRILHLRGMYAAFGTESRGSKVFEEIYAEFYSKHRAHRKYELGTEWFTKWGVSVVFFGFLLAVPFLAVEHVDDVSRLVGLIKVFGKVSKYMLLCTKATTAMQRGSIGLREVMGILNAETRSGVLLQQARHGQDLPQDSKVRVAEVDSAWSCHENLSLISEVLFTMRAPLPKSHHQDKGACIHPAEGQPSSATSPLYKWVYTVDDPACFNAIRLQNVSLSVPSEKGTASLLEDVNLVIPLGGIMAVTGKPLCMAPINGGKTVDRGILLELISGQRFPTTGLVMVPPDLVSVLLTEENLAVSDGTVEEALLFGHPSPKEAPDELVEAACTLAGVAPWLMASRKTQCITRNIRSPERSAIVLASVLLSDCDLLLLHGVERMFDVDECAAFFKRLQESWILTGGLPTQKSRARTAFVTCSQSSVPDVAQYRLELGDGHRQTGVSMCCMG